MKKNCVAFILLCLIMLFLFPATGAYAEQDEQKILGIVALPQLCYWTCEGYDEPLSLYTEPDLEKTPATFLLNEDIDNWPVFEEYDYEQAGAVVYEERDDWYRISRNGEFFWVNKKDTGAFHPYPQILENKLVFLMEKDPMLWPSPSEQPEKLTYNYRNGHGNELPVTIKKMKQIKDKWWIQIDVLDSAPCAGNEAKIIKSGWVPAYTEDNRLQLWFYSRGC